MGRRRRRRRPRRSNYRRRTLLRPPLRRPPRELPLRKPHRRLPTPPPRRSAGRPPLRLAVDRALLPRPLSLRLRTHAHGPVLPPQPNFRESDARPPGRQPVLSGVKAALVAPARYNAVGAVLEPDVAHALDRAAPRLVSAPGPGRH